MNVENWNKEKGLKPSHYTAPCPACGKYPYVSKHKDTQGHLYFSVAHYCDPGDHIRGYVAGVLFPFNYCPDCGARMDDRTGQIERIDNT